MDGLPMLGKRPFTLKATAAAEACAKCRFSFPDGPQLLCRRYPPQVTMVLAPTKLAGQMQPVALGAYPAVLDQQWCGEWMARPAAQSEVSKVDTHALCAKYPMASEKGDRSEILISAGDWPTKRRIDLTEIPPSQIDDRIQAAYGAILAEIDTAGMT